ncbi:hypothetical protein VNO77_34564 [Canavalia gladiata]|uniref:Uncharacterized protein n=1 Tax=Canavalia gladiata TaxID=3824 RepID=A0AAN9PZW9_CANGL
MHLLAKAAEFHNGFRDKIEPSGPYLCHLNSFAPRLRIVETGVLNYKAWYGCYIIGNNVWNTKLEARITIVTWWSCMRHQITKSGLTNAEKTIGEISELPSWKWLSSSSDKDWSPKVITEIPSSVGILQRSRCLNSD